MKKNYPAVMLGIGFVSFLIGAECPELQARPEDVPTVIEVQPPIKKAEDPKPAEASPASPAGSPAQATPAPGGANTTATTPTATATNDTAVTPETLQPSPALAEVIRLLQGGVSEEVVLAYITNSAEPFNIGADEILFLHDLGAPPYLITTLIQKDSSPQMMALKQSANAVKPLPPGVALTTPATNIFAASAPTNNAAEPVPVNPPAAAEPAATVAYTPPVIIEQPSYFYDELAPYGTWIEVSGYGRCWRPTVAVWNSSWRPYCDGGRWLWTDCGWYWYSDYSWGWAPFHYGRWTCPVGLGWVWQPDTCWGPAWVSWRHSASYCGWAPLPPSAHFVLGHGFYHNSLAVGFGFEFGLHASDYVFVSAGGLCDRRPRYLSRAHAATIYKDTTIVNNYTTVHNTTVVNHGVGFERIQRATRGNIRQVALKGTTDVRITNTRREVLDRDGKTLTVAQPAKVAAPNAQPARPGSSTAASGFRPRTERRVATAPNPKDASTASSAVDSGSSQRQADFRGGGGSVPRTGFVTRSPGAPSKAPVTTSGGGAPTKVEVPKAAPATPASPAAREPKNPFAPVTVRGVTPRPSRNEQPMVSDNPASRAEPTRRFSQPGPIRAPVAEAPAPRPAQPQPRVTVPSAPAPSIPAPSRSFTPPGRANIPVAPRGESYRAPGPPPVIHSAPSAPSAPRSAPAPSPRSESSRGSGGGESRSRGGGSDDGGGGGRRGR